MASTNQYYCRHIFREENESNEVKSIITLDKASSLQVKVLY